MRKLGWKAVAALLVAMALVTVACSGDEDAGDESSGSPAADDDQSNSGELGTGVTEDTVKIGFSYVDLESLAEAGILEITHGPYEEIMTALVDDLNANGGINGRQVEVVYGKYSPIANEESLATCATFTEDEQVFAVLGGFQSENNLCVVEQHETVLVGGIQSDALLERARAPWISYDVAAEHSVLGLVRGLEAEGELEGRTIAVYGAAGDEAAIETAKDALADAGAEVTFEALLDTTPGDVAAATSANTTFAQRMQNEGVDAVLVAGAYVPARDFDTAGFHPRLWISSVNSVAAEAFTTDFTVFPDLLTTGGTTTDQLLASDAYQQCESVYEEASGVDVLPAAEEAERGESTGFVALTIACDSLNLFKAAAEAAGDVLNQDTFLDGAESLTDISLVRLADASYGPDKYDGANELNLLRFNSAYEPNGPEEVALPVGDPIPVVD